MSDMTAFQQGIHVALGLDLLKAVLGYDLVEEVAVTRQRGKVLFGELTPLRAEFLENNLLVAAVVSGFAAAVSDALLVAVSTSKARIKYRLNDYKRQNLHKIEA